MEKTLNAMMHSERTSYLGRSPQNKGKGYRKAFAVGLGKQIELKIPRDRLGLFQPVVLALIRDHKQQIEDLSFELYGNGLTTSQIGNVMKRFMGNIILNLRFQTLHQPFIIKCKFGEKDR